MSFFDLTDAVCTFFFTVDALMILTRCRLGGRGFCIITDQALLNMWVYQKFVNATLSYSGYCTVGSAVRTESAVCDAVGPGGYRFSLLGFIDLCSTYGMYAFYPAGASS